MKKYLSVILCIVVLAGAVLGTLFWARAFYQSLTAYQSPLAEANLPAPSVEISKPTGVVVVLVSGLNEDSLDLLTLPNLAQISQTGAGAIIQGVPPSYSQTSRWGVLTGAPPETNGAPPVDLPGPASPPVNSDTIFARAHAAGLKTALVGGDDWRQLVPPGQLDETFFVNAAGPEADQLIFENAQLLLQAKDINLLFVHFTQLAYAAHYQGGTSGAAYAQAAGQIDVYLGQLYQSIDFGRRVLVILGDNGFTVAGGYGGAEPEVTRRPLVMIGDAIVPGNYSDISPNDVAPTVTTLLGAAPPALAQGRILFEMLRLDQTDQTVAQLALARQRFELAQAYTAAITGQPAAEDLANDLHQAELSFGQKNANGAFQLALLAQHTADTAMTAVRRQQIRAEQWPRLAGAALVFLVWALVMWRRRGVHLGLILFAAIVTIGLYHVLYQLQGLEYSISVITNFTDWPFAIARRITVSLLAGGGLILIMLMLLNEQRWLTLLGTAYGFGLLVTFIFALPLFWAFWQNGVTFTWHLPAVDVTFWQVNALFETMLTASLSLLLPWPTMLFILFVALVRRSLNKTQAQPKPESLPGLRL